MSAHNRIDIPGLWQKMRDETSTITAIDVLPQASTKFNRYALYIKARQIVSGNVHTG
ncbi:hypothetical protein ACGE24_03450 [Corynebacterium kroppenstedtii]|uniref:hypothetical protein n=1 Tax=Corynebacterium sp. PCR 32 TaxID=3351342 RepID=UPI0030B487D2